MALDTSPRRGIDYPDPTTKADAPDVTTHIKYLVDALDNDVIWLTPGTAAARPATPIIGSVYHATDTGELSAYVAAATWITLYSPSNLNPGMPVGAAIEWDYGSADIPSWSLLQYGQAVARAGYPTLNTLASDAGYPHGNGDGATTFNIADKRGRVSAGKDDMGGAAANRITAAISGTAGTVLGAAVGNEGVTLSTAQIPSHNHGITGAPGMSDPGHVNTLPAYARVDGVHSSPVAQWGSGGTTGDAVTQTNSATTGISVSAGSLGTANAGSGGTHLNMSPTIIVNKIVRAL